MTTCYNSRIAIAGHNLRLAGQKIFVLVVGRSMVQYANYNFYSLGDYCTGKMWIPYNSLLLCHSS